MWDLQSLFFGVYWLVRTNDTELGYLVLFEITDIAFWQTLPIQNLKSKIT